MKVIYLNESVSHQIKNILLELKEELIDSINHEAENEIDMDQKKKDLLDDLLAIDNKKINNLAGHSELLTILKRSNSITNNSDKTTRLDISNIMENSFNKMSLRGAIAKRGTQQRRTLLSRNR